MRQDSAINYKWSWYVREWPYATHTLSDCDIRASSSIIPRYACWSYRITWYYSDVSELGSESICVGTLEILSEHLPDLFVIVVSRAECGQKRDFHLRYHMSVWLNTECDAE